MGSEETVAFLQAVLPSEGNGFYVAVTFREHRPTQTTHSTIKELARKLLHEDEKGHTVYFACATIKDARGVYNEKKKKFETRCHANAAFARALWADLDAGPGKPYSDASAAYAALVSFVAAAGLPAPLVAGSGSGLHCYWLLSEAVSAQDWQPLALAFKQLCLDQGLHIDPSRTADISSILRPVGTHNRKKNGAERVRAGEAVQSNNSEFFKELLHLGALRARGHFPGVAQRKRRKSLYGAIHASSPGDFGPTAVEQIADRCPQFAAFRESGDIPEPVWNACAGVCAKITDGQVKFHEYSRRDFPDYDYDEAQRKLDNAEKLTGPTTCAGFMALNPAGCKGCVHLGRITTPAQLGTTNPARVVGQADRSKPGDAPASAGAAVFTSTLLGVDRGIAPEIPTGQRMLPALRDPFRWSSTGALLYATETPDGKPLNFTISETPIFLDCVRTAELDEHRFSYTFWKFLPQEGWINITIDAKTLHSASGTSELAGKGGIVHDGKMFMQYVRGAVDDYHREKAVGMRYDQFGWKNDYAAFLFGRYLYTPAGPVEAVGAEEVEKRSREFGPRPGGSREGWTAAADQLFADKMEVYGFGVLCGFAAPLMTFAEANEGGCIVHFVSKSGEGKSLVGKGAWTIWGTKDSSIMTTRDTNVAKGIVLGTLCNLPVVFDELNSRDPQWIKDFIYTFSDGRDRLRGRKDGGLVHTKANWATIMLSNANRSLIEIATVIGADAPGMRVFEFTPALPPGVDKARGEALSKELEINAGWAGDAFIRYLLAPGVVPVVKNMIQQYVTDIYAKTQLPSAHRFRVRLVACVAVAGAIANHLELLHFDVDRIVNYLIGQLTSQDNLGMTDVDPVELAIASLSRYLNEHNNEFLQVADRFRPKSREVMPTVAPRGAVVSMRHEVNTRRLYIDAHRFREWAITSEMSPKQILTVLRSAQVVIDTKHMITLTAGTGIPGGQVPCVEVNMHHPAMSGMLALVHDLEMARPSNDSVETG